MSTQKIMKQNWLHALNKTPLHHIAVLRSLTLEAKGDDTLQYKLRHVYQLFNVVPYQEVGLKWHINILNPKGLLLWTGVFNPSQDNWESWTAYRYNKQTMECNATISSAGYGLCTLHTRGLLIGYNGLDVHGRLQYLRLKHAPHNIERETSSWKPLLLHGVDKHAAKFAAVVNKDMSGWSHLEGMEQGVDWLRQTTYIAQGVLSPYLLPSAHTKVARGGVVCAPIRTAPDATPLEEAEYLFLTPKTVVESMVERGFRQDKAFRDACKAYLITYAHRTGKRYTQRTNRVYLTACQASLGALNSAVTQYHNNVVNIALMNTIKAEIARRTSHITTSELAEQQALFNTLDAQLGLDMTDA